ncbi:MAG: HAMP domain-containing histidine kinase [Prevotella sp.]|nr:HAMP domain-containing histidine kinase [Prevotella sp.]
MDRKKNFQNEIARKILIQVGSLTMLMCIGLLLVFGLEMYWARSATLTTGYVVRTLLEVLGATCLSCVLMFVALYFVSRSVARKSVQPLHEALERERSFTSYASHEFRTPLAVLKGSMEVLIRKPRTEEEYRTKIKDCIAEVDAMNQMVEDLLTLTRVENGRRMLERQTIDVGELLNDVASHYAEQLISRNISIDISTEPEGLTVDTDRRALNTIMSNLVSNAVKYCNVGGTISISSYRQVNAVVIRVVNTGDGISRDELSQVFNQFYRGSATQQRHVKGFGLGLAIVRQFADLIGAQVTIDSEPGRSTTVVLTISDSKQKS